MQEKYGGCDGHRSQLKELPNGQSWNHLSNELHNVVWDYKPKYKINFMSSH